MADGGGQRLLDVIDDPNALESFLGGLTSESDLLPSAESVDTVVASLQSLAADYDVDSPNETLFDTLEASPNNLTDISQSYVPSDFEGGNSNVVYGLSNGTPGNEELVNSVVNTTAAGSFPVSSAASTGSNINALVNNSTLEFPTSVCDSNEFVLGQHIPITTTSASSSCETSLSFSQLTDLHTQEAGDGTEEQQQQQQVSHPSLSSVSSSNNNDIVSNNISSGSANNNLNSAGLTNTSSSPLISLHNNNVVVSTNNNSSTMATSSSNLATSNSNMVTGSSSMATIPTSSPVTSSSAGIQRQLQQLPSQQPQQQQSSQNLQFTLQQVSTAQQQPQQQQLSLQQPQVSTVQHLSLQQPQVSTVQHLSLQQPQVSTVQHLSLQQPQVTVSTAQQQLTLQPQQLQQIQQSIQQQINQQQANQQFQIQQQSPQVSQPSLVVSSVANNVTSHVGSISTSTAPQISVQISQHQQQPSSQPSFIVNTNGHQTINQIVQQQQQSQQNSVVSLSNMTMGSLMSSTANNSLMSNVISSAQGTNLMLSTGGQGQQFITVEQPQSLLGGATFGGGNFVLSAGGAYAVLPTGPQIFANAIVQPQQLQALKNATTGQTFFQTANGSIVAAPAGTSIAGLQGAVQNVQSIRAKTQPQILPKPSSSGGTIVATSAVATSSEVTNTTTTTADHGAAQGQVSVNVGQLLQQQGQIQVQNHHHQGATGIVTSVPNGGVTLSQPSFTINNAGQVVMAGATAAPQAQLAGATTIVLNQFGQPVLLPTGGASQNNGLQFILRQQPAQPQVLTIQAPHQGTATSTAAAIANSAVQGATNVKQVVRYVPQLTQNQTVQIQQIQTPNGPAYIAVRCPQQQQPSQATTAAQIVAAATTGTVQASTTTSTEVQQQQQQTNPTVVTSSPRTPVSQHQSHASSSIINTLQQQTLASITQKTKQQITIKAERVDQQQQQQRQFTSTPPTKPSAIAESPTTPKKKKPASKAKKKVMLDLDEILKQSGIGDEDLQDDSCFENIPSMTLQADTSNGYGYQSSVPTTQKPNGSMVKQELPVNILSPHVHVLQPTTTLPKGGRSNNNIKNNSLSPGGAGSSSNNNSTNVVLAKKSAPNNNNKKSPVKRKSDLSNGGEPPAKMIMSSPAANSKPLNNFTTQKFTVGNNSSNKNNSPKPQNNYNNNNNNNFNKNSPINNNNNKKKPSPKRNAPVTPKGNNFGKTVQQGQFGSTPSTPTAAVTASPSITTTVPQQSPTPVNGSTQPQQQQQRIVHTIQLTPQNQQLLRNIQVQIHRLMALPKRNETEQTALQKLIFLQQQVIATGTPVSSPAGGNLSGNVMTGAVTSNGAQAVNSAVNSSTATSSTTTIPTPSPAQPTIIVSIPTTSINGTQVATTTNTTTNQTISMGPSSCGVTAGPAPVGGVNSIQSSGQNTPSLYLANAQNCNLVIKNENKTDVTDSRIPDLGIMKGVSNSGPSQGFTSGSTVLVVEDPKIAEQRRAAAKAEEEARAKWRKEQFDFLLKRDQEFFVEPDYKTPFTSKEDAVERLMKYHLGRDKTEMDFEDFDEEFSDTAVRLLDKFSAMVAKYKYLMLKESIKETNCAERVMVERMFCNEEKLKLEQDKLLVAQGEILELPPAPDEWMPKLEEMVEADMREMELDSSVNLQVQSAIDSIIGFGTDDSSSYHVPDESEKIEYDAFGVPTGNSSSYGGIGTSSSADIDEAVRSILA